MLPDAPIHHVSLINFVGQLFHLPGPLIIRNRPTNPISIWTAWEHLGREEPAADSEQQQSAAYAFYRGRSTWFAVRKMPERRTPGGRNG
jgi:hypothetical protein